MQLKARYEMLPLLILLQFIINCKKNVSAWKQVKVKAGISPPFLPFFSGL